MTLPVGLSATVKVPATSANLGPGFDTLGLALALYDELTVTVVDGTGVHVEVTGVGKGEVPTDESNLVARAIRYTFDAVGQPMPGLRLDANNVIPHGSGLGSSAAAIVSGIMAAKGLLEGSRRARSRPDARHRHGARGPPGQRRAPALFGGSHHRVDHARGPACQEAHRAQRVYRPSCVSPDHSVSTALARSLQPASVPYEDAVFNLSRSALLIAALVQSPELLFQATEDKLHQDYRASAMPETNSLVHAAARPWPRGSGLGRGSVDPRARRRPLPAARRGRPRGDQEARRTTGSRSCWPSTSKVLQ